MGIAAIGSAMVLLMVQGTAYTRGRALQQQAGQDFPSAQAERLLRRREHAGPGGVPHSRLRLVQCASSVGAPEDNLLTMTWLLETYVNSKLPL